MTTKIAVTLTLTSLLWTLGELDSPWIAVQCILLLMHVAAAMQCGLCGAIWLAP